ncbi:TPA: hypothetical protein GX533_00580 [Candidatus Dojkabacteria bacterium]|uniref:Uncharacterized protein n=1 Tax=Candidatus Dojkabacteria bacterium TaxID=2099670 RepID=A0A832QBX3_9BACT|nr:hypothetical protein [Candidatus Dojkabacteria bacterium]
MTIINVVGARVTNAGEKKGCGVKKMISGELIEVLGGYLDGGIPHAVMLGDVVIVVMEDQSFGASTVIFAVSFVLILKLHVGVMPVHISV